MNFVDHAKYFVPDINVSIDEYFKMLKTNKIGFKVTYEKNVKDFWIAEKDGERMQIFKILFLTEITDTEDIETYCQNSFDFVRSTFLNDKIESSNVDFFRIAYFVDKKVLNIRSLLGGLKNSGIYQLYNQFFFSNPNWHAVTINLDTISHVGVKVISRFVRVDFDSKRTFQEFVEKVVPIQQEIVS